MTYNVSSGTLSLYTTTTHHVLPLCTYISHCLLIAVNTVDMVQYFFSVKELYLYGII